MPWLSSWLYRVALLLFARPPGKDQVRLSSSGLAESLLQSYRISVWMSVWTTARSTAMSARPQASDLWKPWVFVGCSANPKQNLRANFCTRQADALAKQTEGMEVVIIDWLAPVNFVHGKGVDLVKRAMSRLFHKQKETNAILSIQTSMSIFDFQRGTHSPLKTCLDMFSKKCLTFVSTGAPRLFRHAGASDDGSPRGPNGIHGEVRTPTRCSKLLCFFAVRATSPDRGMLLTLMLQRTCIWTSGSGRGQWWLNVRETLSSHARTSSHTWRHHTHTPTRVSRSSVCAPPLHSPNDITTFEKDVTIWALGWRCIKMYRKMSPSIDNQLIHHLIHFMQIVNQ